MDCDWPRTAGSLSCLLSSSTFKVLHISRLAGSVALAPRMLHLLVAATYHQPTLNLLAARSIYCKETLLMRRSRRHNMEHANNGNPAATFSAVRSLVGVCTGDQGLRTSLPRCCFTAGLVFGKRLLDRSCRCGETFGARIGSSPTPPRKYRDVFLYLIVHV